MARAILTLALFFSLVAATTAQLGWEANKIHDIRPRSVSGRHGIPGVSCLSWRLGVETNNIIAWATVPIACEGYVGHYMLGKQYRDDSKAVINEAFLYAKSLKLPKDGKNIWIFDIDETALSNLPYFANNGFGANPVNVTSLTAWVVSGKAPALPESLKLYRVLVRLKIKIVFLTGRVEGLRAATTANLKRAGFDTWERLILKGSNDTGKTAFVFKSGERNKLESEGYRIVGNIGDQWSDILGTNTGNRTFKLPDPMYYIS